MTPVDEILNEAASPEGVSEAAGLMATPDIELLKQLLSDRNGYGSAGRPTGTYLVKDESEDGEGEGGGIGKWYKMSQTGAEISQRTLNSVIEDAELSDPLALKLVLLLDSLARWQFSASCNNRQEHIDALMMETLLLESAVEYWSREGNAGKIWQPRRDSDLLEGAKDGPYLRQAVSRVGLLHQYEPSRRLTKASERLTFVGRRAQRVYLAWDRAIDRGVCCDYSYLRDMYAMPVDPDTAGLKSVIAPFFAQELHAVCMATVAGQRAGKWQAAMARILQNFRGGGDIEQQRMTQGFFERSRRERRLERTATTSAEVGYARAE